MDAENLEKHIQDIITNDIFKLFTNGKFKEAKLLLNQLYLNNYDDIRSLYTRRLLIHNLAWVENKLGDINSSKKHIKMIKEELELDSNYINTNMLDYCLILNLYCELFKNEISLTEYKEINLFISNYHHQTGNIGRKSVSLANIFLIEKRWDELISLILSLKEQNIDEFFIDAILEELEKVNVDIFKKATNLLNGGVF
ncbi:hypothetical protein NNC19_22290 [Clostridium sp. SHJSY1]|uniref:hypothetical protein n=1 Tax=Clostridium sp. SHJSY1 TaxID=2942483 RepID=UPI002876960E|nr:hypothetical protein [Clostridium sp. SHJSY1]MDS0528422.1 hypothetical protein [Clostridium sp. SHJSY1]